jgi:glycosyltransferase involved in cell wall biosynthesis
MVDRVLLISSWYPSLDRPAQGAFVEDQVMALKRRHKVAVIAPRPGGWSDRIRGASGDPQLERISEIDVIRVNAIAAIPRSRRSGYAAQLAAVRRAYRLGVQRFGRPDLLHAHVVRHAGWAAVRLGREERLPVVLTEHSGPFTMHLESAIDRRNVAVALGGADAVVAVSPALRDAIRSFLPIDVAVVGNTVDTDFFSPIPGAGVGPRDDQPFRVLTAAILGHSKRMDRVLEAAALFDARSARPVELVVVGDGPARKALEAQASALGIAARTTFAGMVDRRRIRDEMRRADAFVLASDAETFGVVIAEAMACGTPAIASRAGGPDFIIEPGTGILVPVGDVGAIAAALHGVAMRTVPVDVGAARSSIIRRFGADAFLDAIGGIYERVIAARAQGGAGFPESGRADNPI